MWSIAPPRVPTYHSALDASRASSIGRYETLLTSRIAALASTTSADEEDAPPPAGILESTTKSNPRKTMALQLIPVKKTAPFT